MSEQDQAAGVAVVTGAGTGLGQALAIELARRGRTVVGLGRSIDGLGETQSRIGGDLFKPVVTDVGDGAAVLAAVARIESTIGPIGILINNAAVYERFDFVEAAPERFMAAVQVNLGGVVYCTHAVLQGMTARGHGRIVNVTTFADLAPLSGSSAYSVSKGAARIFTRALLADLADRFPAIVVSDWIPGALATRMGIADGIPPEVAARWGVALALQDDPALNGRLFDRDCEVLPPRSVKQRLKDVLLLQRRRQPRRLSAEK